MTGLSFALSVDYGTSHTVGMLRWPDGRVRPLVFDGSPLLSSAVFATSDGRILVGRDAERSARVDPARYEPNPKRMVDAGELLLGARAYPIAELVAAGLRRVYAEAVRAAGQAPATVTITHPATWGPARRQVLHSAAALAGLPRVGLVDEPSAAAAYFVRVLGRQLAPGQAIMVFDLGAGTFDVSVVRRTPGSFETVATDGMDAFGGVDLDAIVVERIGAAVAASDPERWRRLTVPAGPEDLRDFRLFWDDAKAAKEMLSRQPTASVHLPILNRDVHVTREEFEQAARPVLTRAVRLAVQTLDNYHRDHRERVSAVFLVGGSTRIPLVATLLHQHSEMAPVAIEQPEFVVAEGGLHLPAMAIREPVGVAGHAETPNPHAGSATPPGAPTPLSGVPPTPPGASAPVPGPLPGASAPPWGAAGRTVPRRRRRAVVAGAVAVVVLALAAVGGVIWWRTGSPTRAFGDDSDLREFAGRFIAAADRCERSGDATRHRDETGLEMPDDNFRAVVRCQGNDWIGYFYNSGAPRGLPNHSPDDYRTQISDGVIDRYSGVLELSGEVSQQAGSGPLQAYVEFRAASDRPGIYWEPTDRYTYRLGAAVLNLDPAAGIEPLREIWRDHA
ncbi:Hsp70 family protein [Plantactinospora sp. CA-294935]|uniref:Hsp70 family protein n=1 Tax=Plantactinospora sp. CA-294935 TaxID=3240012 RepID=UPI003D8AD701